MGVKRIRRIGNHKIAYLFLLPSLLTLLVFSVIPMLASIVISFLNMDISFSYASFNGIDHFQKALSDERFTNALFNTVVFAFTQMPLQVLLGLITANALVSSSWFNKLCRSLFFVPVICSMTAVGITFSIMLDANIGLVPYLMRKYLGVEQISFFRDPKMAMPTVILMTVWKNFGYTMSILIVGINSISKSYYEAAQIDGASMFRQFWHITLTGIRAPLGFCLITNLIGSLQVFDQVYVTTQGGPQYKTETLVQYIYKTGFTAPFNLGYASAMSTLMLLVILILSVPLYFTLFSDKGNG